MKRGFWRRGAFAACVLGVAAAMIWITLGVRDLEAEARFQENLRLALRRLDDQASRFLFAEASRPPAHYSSFASVEGDVYTRDLQKVAKDELVRPSPLLRGTPPEVRLYFQLDREGRLTSPSLPAGNYLDLAQGVYQGVDPRAREQIELVRGLLDFDELAIMLQLAKGGPDVGRLEPRWQRGELFCLRAARVGDAQVLQGFLLDWPRIRAELLATISDLFPAASLDPVLAGNGLHRMASFPVTLNPTAHRQPVSTRWILAVGWLVVVVAMVATGYMLRRAVVFGEKQRRFASMVTHELRSPLTTFRLYSDLLAEGLVEEPDRRDAYHKTLQKESDQMARMVENVIAHSRLEEGRAQLRAQRVVVSGLLDRIGAELRARGEKAGLEVTVEAGEVGDAVVRTDPGAVEQILFNLVDNACKYGGSKRCPAIHLEASSDAGLLRLRVRDHGAGVPLEVARRIFHPFDRGDRDEADPARGLGLGLPLARGLARDLGGDLTLERPADGGACFVLSLPLAG